MKYSKFNISINYKSNIILYNTLNGNIMALKSALYHKLKNTSIEEIQSTNDMLFNALVERGFLVEEGFDENAHIVSLINDIDMANDSYHLIINPTLDCNFNCWYCFEEKERGSKMSPEIIDKVKKCISSIIGEEEYLMKFTLSFFGGEPLMFFEKITEPIINHLFESIGRRKIETNIHFTTNGYLLNDTTIKQMSKLKVNSLQITFDGGKVFHDKTRFSKVGLGSFDRIVKNVKKVLSETEITVIVRVNYTHENINSIINFLDEFSDVNARSRILLSLNQVWQDKNNNNNNAIDLSDKIRIINKKAKSMGISIKPPSSLNRLRNSCYADKHNQAVINYDGYIFKCNARDFKRENALGVLRNDGKIEWNEKQNRWMISKFQSNLCKECTIFPVCGGGCRRLSTEADGADYCIYDNEDDKKQMILDMLLMEEG